MTVLFASCMMILQSTPEEIRQALEGQIRRAQEGLARLEASVARADQEIDRRVKEIVAGEGNEEEKKKKVEEARGARHRLATGYFHLGEPSAVKGELPAESREALKKASDRLTGVLRATEEYYKAADPKDVSKARAFVYDSGWQIAKLAEGAAASAKQAEKGLRTLPDDRPLSLLTADLPNPLAEALGLIGRFAASNDSTFAEVARLTEARRGREAADLAARLLDANRIGLARLRRAQMLLESYSQAQSEIDAALEKAVPILRAGVLAAPAEVARLRPAREMLRAALGYLAQGADAHREALQAALQVK